MAHRDSADGTETHSSEGGGELVVVFATKDRAELMVVRGLLASGDIPSHVPSNSFVSRAILPRFLSRSDDDDSAGKQLLYVRAEDAAVARELLASFEEFGDPVDAEAYETLRADEAELESTEELSGGQDPLPGPIRPR